MDERQTLAVIARLRGDFPQKFGIPRQSGLVEALTARIVFEPTFRSAEALRGLEGFSHIWLIWGFSEQKQAGWSPTVRPPRLGGNRRMGVFATRSPFRPNPLGLSCVRLLGTEPDGSALRVAGADLMDGSPIYDIKPYLPYADCRPEATGGFVETHARKTLAVEIDPALLAPLPPSKQEVLRDVLAQDPRPPYHEDSARVYGMTFAGLCVKFTVSEGRLTVISTEEAARP